MRAGWGCQGEGRHRGAVFGAKGGCLRERALGLGARASRPLGRPKMSVHSLQGRAFVAGGGADLFGEGAGVV